MLTNKQLDQYGEKQNLKMRELQDNLIRYRITPLMFNTDEKVALQLKVMLGGGRP